MYKLDGQITQEFLGLRMQNFQGIDFIWTQKYRKIFKNVSFKVGLICVKEIPLNMMKNAFYFI